MMAQKKITTKNPMMARKKMIMRISITLSKLLETIWYKMMISKKNSLMI